MRFISNKAGADCRTQHGIVSFPGSPQASASSPSHPPRGALGELPQ